MKLTKHSSNPLITGTLLLTLTGLLSRVIGFFYRIFLSRTIGAEGLGIYQLIFPLLTLCIAFSSAGIQTAISKFVAAENARKCKNAGMSFLYAGMLLSVSLSLLVSSFLIRYSDFIALHILGEIRCTNLLVIMAYAVPLAGIHSCINGYYYGLKKTTVPAATQLLEQTVRVISVFVMYFICQEKASVFSPELAVFGLVCGEFSSMLVSLSCVRFRKCRGQFKRAFTELLRFSIPLTTNRVTYHLFASMEAILIPIKLRAFGYSSGEALSVFGNLNGMAIPMIMFPSVVVNSVSVLLLPTISEAAAGHDRRLIVKATRKTIFCCLSLGFVCTAGFLFTGRFIGEHIFHNTLSGTFILILSWICPFLYLATTLSSILHGLGKASTAFLINLGGSLIRIAFVFCFIPSYGIRSYLYGMLVSQIFIALLSLSILLHKMKKLTQD